MENNSISIKVDGTKANKKPNGLYGGFGMISANNSSRLLLDYKAENPDSYWRILECIFGKEGLGMTHLKLEMGSDVNSSSGTEPCIMRKEDERPDVTRGAGYQLAYDAKQINPDLTLDMLRWSEPAWITKGEDVFEHRYKWYKSTLEAAYHQYGLVFDYISANQNEREVDSEWMKYLSSRLKGEKNGAYDYSKIKLIAADEEGHWNVAEKMLSDRELLEAIDVIGSHYTDWSTDEVKKLYKEYGKKIWFSEGCPPMSYSEETHRYDEVGSGLTGINGVLDIANRIITMYPGGDMTLYEFQPVVSAYYDGVTYCSKQLITANNPWSGYYKLDSGYYMALHFSRFLKKGWSFIDGACAGDGKKGGDGHAVIDASYSYITACDPNSEDYSVVITNTTNVPKRYQIHVSNLKTSTKPVYMWETRGPGQNGRYNDNYFKKVDTILPRNTGDGVIYDIEINPYSLVTLSTLDIKVVNFEYIEKDKEKHLSLPYTDDYEYADYQPNYLIERGGAPKYTTDEGGAFEVVHQDGNNVLMQKITLDMKPREWGYTPDPVTNFGDDTWFNYKAQVDVRFDINSRPDENYVGVGIRYNLGDAGVSGYSMLLYADGRWEVKRNKELIMDGTIVELDVSSWNNIGIIAVEDRVSAYFNNTLLASNVVDVNNQEPMHTAGRCALYSAYYCNCFDNFEAIDIEGVKSVIKRLNNMDETIHYSSGWEHVIMSSFKNYYRTVSRGKANETVEIEFIGTGFAIIGENESCCAINVELDGNVIEDEFLVAKADYREANYYRFGLENGKHTVKITVLNGSYIFDAVEITEG